MPIIAYHTFIIDARTDGKICNWISQEYQSVIVALLHIMVVFLHVIVALL